MGDFNTAHREIDLARPRENQKTSGFLPEERAELDRWLAAGWVDAFRRFEPGSAATTPGGASARARASATWAGASTTCSRSPAAMRFAQGAWIAPASARLGSLPGRRRPRSGSARMSEAHADPEPDHRLDPKRKSIYAAGDFTLNTSLAALSLIYASYFLPQVADVRAALAGLIPLIARTLDAFADPLMGRLSDRTRWALGRRRPYFLLGALPYGVTFALLWIESPLAGAEGRFAYYTLIYLAHALSMTVLAVPYLAILPEMALDYDARTSLNTYRTVGSILGVFAAVAVRPTAECARWRQGGLRRRRRALRRVADAAVVRGVPRHLRARGLPRAPRPSRASSTACAWSRAIAPSRSSRRSTSWAASRWTSPARC